MDYNTKVINSAAIHVQKSIDMSYNIGKLSEPSYLTR